MFPTFFYSNALDLLLDLNQLKIVLWRSGELLPKKRVSGFPFLMLFPVLSLLKSNCNITSVNVSLKVYAWSRVECCTLCTMWSFSPASQTLTWLKLLSSLLTFCLHVVSCCCCSFAVLHSLKWSCMKISAAFLRESRFFLTLFTQ